MDPTTLITAVVTGLVTGGGTVAIISKVAVKHVTVRLSQIPKNERRIISLEKNNESINGDLRELKATTLRIESNLATLGSDVAFLRGRFEGGGEK